LCRSLAVIGLGREIAAERGLRIGLEDRKIERAAVPDEERLVVGDELREQRRAEQRQEDPERPESAPVGAEIGKAPPRQRRDGYA
jgi:hypothetical protein